MTRVLKLQLCLPEGLGSGWAVENRPSYFVLMEDIPSKQNVKGSCSMTIHIVEMTGKIIDGHDRQKVIGSIQKVFGVTSAKAEAMLSGSPKVIKRCKLESEASKYRATLTKIGVEVAGTSEALSSNSNLVQNSATDEVEENPKRKQPESTDIQQRDAPTVDAPIDVPPTDISATNKPVVKEKGIPWKEILFAVLGVTAVTYSLMPDDSAENAATTAETGSWYGGANTNAGERQKCELTSAPIDSAGNKLIVNALDKGLLWLPAMYFFKNSELSPTTTGSSKIFIDGHEALNLNVEFVAEADGVRIHQMKFPMSENTVNLLAAFFNEGLLTIEGSSHKPISISLTGFGDAAESYASCLNSNETHNYSFRNLLASSDPVWVRFTEDMLNQALK